MTRQKTLAAHLIAIFTIVIWGTTFASTKALLEAFNPIEIMFFRFLIAYVLLLIIQPKFLPFRGLKKELPFIGLGLCGVTFYYIAQNLALTYTNASIVGIIVAVSPFLTGLFSQLLLKQKVLSLRYLGGFALAFSGVCMITFNGSEALGINPLGSLLALLSALSWAFYNIIMTKVSQDNGEAYPLIPFTRRIFFYGVLFMLPFLFPMGFRLDLARFADTGNLLHMLFLSVAASTVGYLTWNFATKTLGAITTSLYLYSEPIVAIVSSFLLLGEGVTTAALFGVALIIAGLVLSQQRQEKETLPDREGASAQEACAAGQDASS